MTELKIVNCPDVISDLAALTDSLLDFSKSNVCVLGDCVYQIEHECEFCKVIVAYNFNYDSTIKYVRRLIYTAR